MGPHWSPEEESHCAEAGVGLSRKGSHMNAQGLEVYGKVQQNFNIQVSCSQQLFLLLPFAQGSKMVSIAPFVLQGSATSPKCTLISVPMQPRGLSDTLSFPGPLPSFPTRAPLCPTGSTWQWCGLLKHQSWDLMFVKTCNNQPLLFCQLMALVKFFLWNPLHAVHVFSFSLLSPFMIRAPSPLQHPQSLSPPNHVSVLPTFHNMAFFLPLVLQFFLSVHRSTL